MEDFNHNQSWTYSRHQINLPSNLFWSHSLRDLLMMEEGGRPARSPPTRYVWLIFIAEGVLLLTNVPIWSLPGIMSRLGEGLWSLLLEMEKQQQEMQEGEDWSHASSRQTAAWTLPWGWNHNLNQTCNLTLLDLLRVEEGGGPIWSPSSRYV